MNRGYVHFWRKSLDSGWLRNHQLWVFWSYCLLKATHREYDAIVGLQRVHLNPGQFIFGRRQASIETGLTERQIRTIIEFLKKAGNLTIKTTNRFSIISIINWDIYQGRETQNDQQNDQLPTSKRPHTITKEHKHNKRGATLAPDNFLISDKMREYAKTKGFTGNLENLSEKFLNYHRAKGSKFSDWNAALRNWIIRELEFNPPPAAATDQPLNQGRSLEDILS
ncbi:MAG: hypothetical protein WC082_11955 [Victivallales bacterium]